MNFLWRPTFLHLSYMVSVCQCYTELTSYDGRHKDKVHNDVFDMKALLDHVKSQKPLFEQFQKDLESQNDSQAALDNIGQLPEMPAEVKSQRLRNLATAHDNDKDGHIDEKELREWVMQSFNVVEREDAHLQMHESDRDGDGRLSFSELVERHHGVMDGDTSYMDDEGSDTFQAISHDKRRFTAADENSDGILEEHEFMAYFQPHSFPHMFDIEIERMLKQMDDNSNGFVSMEEFLGGHDSEEDHVKSDSWRFEELDKDKNWKLNLEELRPYVLSGKDDMADEEVTSLYEKVDENKDGKLSMEEIERKGDEFLSSSVTDYGHILRFIKDEL